MIRIAVFVSGGGSNLEALLQAWKAGELSSAEIALVVSNRPGVKALERAARYNVPAVVIDHKAFPGEAFESELLRALEDKKIDVICLAGFLRKIGGRLVARYRGRILNIHPALLPKFGGAGMYGHFVHEAVLAAGEKESGCTVHLVDEEYDKGPILGQARVPVLAGDTPDVLAARVLEQEHRLYPAMVKQFCERFVKENQRT